MARRILAILFTLAIIVLSISEGILWVMGSTVMVSPYLLNIAIFIVALLTLIMLLGSRQKNHRYKKIFIKNNSDTIAITEEAIVQLAKNTLRKINNINNTVVRVNYIKDEKIILEISLTLKVGSNIIEVTEHASKQIKEVLESTVGDNLEDVKVTVNGFANYNKQSEMKY